MSEKQKAAQAAAEKFKALPASAKQFVLGYMACYEQLKK